MKGINEPMTKWYGLPVWIIGAAILISAFHWIGKIDPELIDEYGLESVRGFQYNGYMTSIIAGLPSWTFATIIWYVIAAIAGLYATSLWSVDQRINKDQR